MTAHNHSQAGLRSVAQPVPPVSDTQLAELHELGEKAVALAQDWARRAAHHTSTGSARLLADTLKHPGGLAFTTGFVDRVIRPEDDTVAARNLAEIVRHTPPDFLPWHLRTSVRLGAAIGPTLPHLVIPVARRMVRRMVGHLIADARPERLGEAVRVLRTDGRDLNLNLLGEAVLGDEEARARFAGTQQLLARDDVDYVSIKVSAVVSQLNLWSYPETVATIVDRLVPLYQQAAASASPKFINLDMEEYRDLHLTIDVCTRLLDRPELRNLEAGIVLQAYLPDALGALQHLTKWAHDRVAAGGAGIKVRIVKGANLAMERVDAAVHGWENVTWPSKQQTDTNYKRVLNWALRPEVTDAVRFGIAGHNLFDVALVHLLAQQRGVHDRIEFEMLLGMAEGQQQLVADAVGGLLLYTPVVRPEEFDVAISYLIRRLEENAASSNFMSAVFDIGTDDRLFSRERDRFLAALAEVDNSLPLPNRRQNRATQGVCEPQSTFANTPDTDPALPQNQPWIRAVVDASAESTLGSTTVAEHRVATVEGADRAIASAREAGTAWAARSVADRANTLRRVAVQLESSRAQLLEVAASEAGKIISEGDVEVSEAIDFANYYADRAEELEAIPGARFEPARVTVVAPPWNFPISIPAGSALAALATGSAVIFKPAPQVQRTGALVAEILWKAGVPRDALKLVIAPENEVGQRLVAHPHVDRVILTGSYETAALFRSWRGDLEVLGETSGKNSVIVTPSADIDQAVAHVAASAFGHAGQKCSAASLVILVGSMGRSERFVRQLVDAARTLIVDQPWNPRTTMSPLIEPPTGKLLKALTTLEPGQRWLLQPQQLDESGRLWSPGIRDGVQPGSECHLTEFFGPVLGIVRVSTLDEAIAVQNGTDYGLTAGLETLDARELSVWLDRVQAGNVYVNRGITGAIVQRQSFGGWKRSAIGPGAKAGGPNYLMRLGSWHRQGVHPASDLPQVTHAAVRSLLKTIDDLDLPDGQTDWLRTAAASDEQAWAEEFGVHHDPSDLRLERNILRYRPHEAVIRASADATLADLIRVALASLRAGSRSWVSTAVCLPDPLADALHSVGMTVRLQTDAELQDAVSQLSDARIRLIGSGADELSSALAARPDVAVYHDEVTSSGRIEQLPFVHEQIVSITAHRFGEPDDWSAAVI